MKVEQEKFAPITITLESIEEAIIIKSLIASLSVEAVNNILGYNYDVMPAWDVIKKATPNINFKIISTK